MAACPVRVRLAEGKLHQQVTVRAARPPRSMTATTRHRHYRADAGQARQRPYDSEHLAVEVRCGVDSSSPSSHGL
ncbi:hypothetical protein TH66_00520 [Carbonactinospora thermoautotrophica]|uniref:Uncharacterized protein n=1 Tax=Carbonactinospora thermoautotrophica TaxID=1469144 RepID=A0A132N777_9ACTN|nr:hypothetical protein TH66_00520 [Carbonactinospora thermoautotrophica]KWX09990.1 hypothetical protein TR74_06330 [Carbonactinospora thermoautotrophica]